MNARGRVVTETKKIHMEDCPLIRGSYNVRRLSTIPANQRNKLSKCKVCKP